MNHYTNKIGNLKSYIKEIYNKGLIKSTYFSDDEIEVLLSNIGFFRIKGYIRAFKNNLEKYSIVDVLILYYFDKYLTRIVMDLTLAIETKLKTIVVELCYKQIKNLPANNPQKNNPFFYLIQNNYKNNFSLNKATVNNWKNINAKLDFPESYLHYGLYYRAKYNFSENKAYFLSGQKLMEIYSDINYPPFHYLIESSTLGTIVKIIKNLKIENFDVLQKVADKFKVTNKNIDFEAYLDRLIEIRNRAAHGERIFNRSYRSIKRTSHFHKISQKCNKHKFVDVYLFLYFMLDRIDNFNSIEIFLEKEIDQIFDNFKKDNYIANDSKNLNINIKASEYENIKAFILKGML